MHTAEVSQLSEKQSVIIFVEYYHMRYNEEQTKETKMSAKTINLRVTGELAEHIERQIGDGGLHENTSEYIRDLIRHDIEEQKDGWRWLRDHLDAGMRADPSEFKSVTADELIQRCKDRS